MPETRQPRRTNLLDRRRRALADGVDRTRRSPARPGPLLDAARAPRFGIADAVQHDADHRHLRAALTGAAEPDRFLDRRAGGDQGYDPPSARTRLSRRHAVARSGTRSNGGCPVGTAAVASSEA